MADYKLSATLELKDKFTAVVGKAKRGMKSFASTLEGASGSVDKTGSAMEKMGQSALSAAAKADKAKRSLEGLKGTYTATIKTNDAATGTVKKVANEIKALTNKTHSIRVGIQQQISGPLGNIKGKLSNAASGFLSGLPTQLVGFAGLGYGVADTLKVYTDFTHQMSRVKAIAGATDDEFARLTAKAKEQGMMTQFTATESGKAMEYMAMAGWKTEDMLNGISGIMSLAAASGEDLGQVSDIVTDALSAFKLQAKDAGHFADVLAQAATNSNTNVGMMGYTFKYVAPLAGTLGFNIEDTALAIGLMANSGIKAEKAGTALRSMFTRMAAPTKESSSAMAELGFSMTDSTGKVKSLRSIMKELRKDFKGLSKMDQTRLAKQLAGEDAISGFLAIMNANESDWKKLETAIDHSQGAAKNMENISTSNLWGSIKGLQSAWEAVQLGIMSQGPGSGMKEFVDAATIDLRKFTKSLEDGFQFKDLVDVAKTAVQQLIDKFLQLDGVGSVLAGGTLAFGITKLIGMLKKFNGLFKTSTVGGNTGTGVGMNDMVVNARNVVVNGTVSGSAGGGATPVPGGKKGSGAAVSAIVRYLPAILTGVKTVYDVTKTEGKEAKTRVGIGGAVQTGAVALGTAIGGPAGTVVGFAVGDAINQAIQDPAWSSQRSSAGSEMYLQPSYDDGLGTNGGVNGDTMGNGQDIASRFQTDMGNFKNWLFSDAPSAMDDWGNSMDGMADRFNQDWENMKQTAQQKLSGIGTAMGELGESIGTQASEMQTSMSNAWENIAQSVSETTSEWGGYVDDAIGAIEGALDGLKSRAAGIWADIKNLAASAWADIGAKASGALSGAQSWFAGTSLGKWWDHNATGSEYYAGGLTEVNEHGGEIIDLPGGSRIYPHATTERMLEKQFAKAAPGAAPTVTISGNTFIVRQESDIQQIAYELAQLIMQGQQNYGGGYA
ncbi:MAG: phage tail tape measure protein [Acidaminococcus fermentans]|uniref:phage tail tape measure protein n=1 Tax=Acidaminococcus fermentans TaxID=905 RepID=UPI002430283A|nr:phage tail tape measure protein [Acidaminococcus fermentans]MCI7194785.1 phage tail tape measure protein [Acidaminococcus fermentans]